MPTYAFVCNKERGGCGCRYEVDLMMSEISTFKAKCPSCKKKVSHQDYSGISIFGPDKTVGSLAEKNTKLLSEEQRKEIFDKNNEYRKKPYTGPIPEGATVKNDS